MEKKEDICTKCRSRHNCSTFLSKPVDAFYQIVKCCYFSEEVKIKSLNERELDKHFDRMSEGFIPKEATA